MEKFWLHFISSDCQNVYALFISVVINVACKSSLSKLWPKQELYCAKFIVMSSEILSYVTQNFTMCNTQRKNDGKLQKKKKKNWAFIQPHPSLPKQAKGSERM